jgi:hypothetical protein
MVSNITYLCCPTLVFPHLGIVDNGEEREREILEN